MSARRPHSADELAAIRRIRAGERAPITPDAPAPGSRRRGRHSARTGAGIGGGGTKSRVVEDLVVLDDDDLDMLAERPRVRGDCVGGPRPCPWVSCRHNTFLDVNEETGMVTQTRLELEDCADTCSLDVADRGGHTLEEVGIVLNVTRERVRQLEAKASEELHLALRRAGIRPGDEAFTHPTTNLP